MGNTSAPAPDLVRDDFYNAGGTATQPVSNAFTPGYYQSFISGGGILQSAKFYLRKVLLPTGTTVAKLYASTGTNGTSAKPTGAALATSDTLDVSTLDGTDTQKTFAFTGVNQITLTASATYCVGLTYNGGDSNNYIRILQIGSPDNTDDGNTADEGPVDTFTVDLNLDIYFEVWVLR